MLWKRKFTLAAERSMVASLNEEVSRRMQLHTQLEGRVVELEKSIKDRREAGNSELLARLQRAEAELGSRRRVR